MHKLRHRPRELLNCVRELDDLHRRNFDIMMRMGKQSWWAEKAEIQAGQMATTKSMPQVTL